MRSKPLLYSHTSPCSREDHSKCWRYRTWKDMELVAKTGGVVCTWPIIRISVILQRSCRMTLEERSRSAAYGDSILSSLFISYR
jgi:hypothetical protein